LYKNQSQSTSKIIDKSKLRNQESNIKTTKNMNFFKALENKSNLIVKFVEPGPKESPNNKTKKEQKFINHQPSRFDMIRRDKSESSIKYIGYQNQDVDNNVNTTYKSDTNFRIKKAQQNVEKLNDNIDENYNKLKSRYAKFKDFKA